MRDCKRVAPPEDTRRNILTFSCVSLGLCFREYIVFPQCKVGKLSIIVGVGVGVLAQRGLMGDIGMDILVAAGTFLGSSQELGADPGFFLGGVYH